MKPRIRTLPLRENALQVQPRGHERPPFLPWRSMPAGHLRTGRCALHPARQRVRSDADRPGRYEVPDGSRFCRIASSRHPGETAFHIASLDDPERIAPERHVFFDKKPGWLRLYVGLPGQSAD